MCVHYTCTHIHLHMHGRNSGDVCVSVYTHICRDTHTYDRVILVAEIMVIGMELGENFEVYTWTVTFNFFYNRHLLL